MGMLDKLKFTVYTKPNNASPEHVRRSKIIKQLREQQALCQAVIAGETFTATRTRNVVDASTGIRSAVSVGKRVKQWWTTQDNGKVALSVRYGSKMLEFSKGKSAIEVASIAQLPDTIQLVIDAVAAGELDAQMEAASSKLRAGFGK